MCIFQGFAINLTGVPVNDRHDLTVQLGWGGLCEANQQPSSLVAWTAGWIDSLVSIGGLCTAIWPSQRKCFLPTRSASTQGCLSFPWVWRGEGLRSEGPQHGCAHVMNVHSYKGTFAPQIQPYLGVWLEESKPSYTRDACDAMYSFSQVTESAWEPSSVWKHKENVAHQSIVRTHRRMKWCHLQEMDQ